MTVRVVTDRRRGAVLHVVGTADNARRAPQGSPVRARAARRGRRAAPTTDGGTPRNGGRPMADSMISAFESSLDKTNLILKDIENAYGWPKERRNQSYAALRTVLHLLRDRLPVDESVEFAQQLPVLVRGIYFDGWVAVRRADQAQP